MKIAHVVDSMEVGGAETLVAQMCRLQRQQGHHPRILAVADSGALGERMRAEGFDVRANIGLHLSDSTRNFFRLFKEWQPDAVHLHNPTPTIYAAPAARAAGVRSIVSTRHSLVAPPHNRMMEVKYGVAARFCNWVVGICDATTDNVRQLRTVPGRKILRIYNGTEPMRRTEKQEQPEKSGFTLIYVGRLEPVKNHPLLLDAFRLATASRPELRLWMVGDGSEREHLERLAAHFDLTEHVTFWGQQADVAPFFSAADAFIMSSHSEGLPISLLQAFSLGLPAIVTDVGGMAEAVRLAGAGRVTRAGDASAMAAAILDVVEHEQERTLYSLHGQAAFRSCFTLDAMTDAYMQLYRKTSRAR